MKKVIFSMAIFAMAAMAFTGCSEKEENPYYGQTTNFTLSVADMNGQKAHMEGNYACWDNGDYVLINDRPFEVTVSGNEAALINGVPVADAYYAIYPIDDVRSDAGATTSVELPESYLYGEVNGNQLSPAPLMACKASPAEPKEVAGQLSFYSVCTQWKVTVPAETYVEKIVVKTTNTVIAGNGTVTIPDNGNPSLTMDANGGKEITVNCNFMTGAVAKDIYIPVPSIANGDNVSVTVFTPEQILVWNKTARQDIQVHYVLSLDMTQNADVYTRVAYLQSNNGSYINTGVNGNNADLTISGAFQFANVKDYAPVFGNYSSEGENGRGWRLIQTEATNTNSAFYMNNNIAMRNSHQIGNAVKTTYHTFEMTKSSILLDGIACWIENANAGTAVDANIALFHRGVGNLAYETESSVKIFNFQIADNTKGLIRDFVPCVKDNVPGMLDCVNMVFYTNANTTTGEFTYEFIHFES